MTCIFLRSSAEVYDFFRMTSTRFSSEILKDIRFWILLFFALRLYGITLPPLEVAHNWRQTTVTMVARNFYEIDANILYPRIDIAGEKSGITGMEFPFFNYLIYLMAELFGYEHWYGRLINLFVSSVGVYAFFRLVKRYFNPAIAFNAALILLPSIWFAYSRKVMPDTFSASLVLIAMACMVAYLDRGKWVFLVLFGGLLSLGLLSKLPSGLLLAAVPLIFFYDKRPVHRWTMISISGLVALIPVVLWYFYWVPELVEQFGFQHFFMGKDLRQGYAEIAASAWPTIRIFIEDALKFIGFGAFLLGLFFGIRKKNGPLLGLLALGIIALLLLMFRAGDNFVRHAYYIVPFVPFMALFAGYGMASLKSQTLRKLFLVLIVIEGIANQYHDFGIGNRLAPLTALKSDLDRLNEDGLVMLNTGEYPTAMYFIHRKGWVRDNAAIAQNDFILDAKEKGLKYIVVFHQHYGKTVALPYEIAVDKPEYTVYKP